MSSQPWSDEVPDEVPDMTNKLSVSRGWRLRYKYCYCFSTIAPTTQIHHSCSPTLMSHVVSKDEEKAKFSDIVTDWASFTRNGVENINSKLYCNLLTRTVIGNYLAISILYYQCYDERKSCEYQVDGCTALSLLNATSMSAPMSSHSKRCPMLIHRARASSINSILFDTELMAKDLGFRKAPAFVRS